MDMNKSTQPSSSTDSAMKERTLPHESIFEMQHEKSSSGSSTNPTRIAK